MAFNSFARKVSAGVIGLFMAGTVISGCASAGSGESRTVYALGTVCNITLYGANDAKGALDEAEQALYSYDGEFSWRRKTSDISRINDNAGEWTDVSRDVYEVLDAAKKLGEKSGGALDVTAGVLTQKWNISEDPTVPDPETIREGVKKIDISRLMLREQSGTYYAKIDEGQSLDVGAIAKGYVGDRLTELLGGKCKSALINLGGNVCALGKKPDGSDFSVGLRDPLGEEGQYFCTVAASDISIVVSGAYERNFTKDGVTYHHILDPDTGYPSDSGLLSSIIACKSSTTADGLSTAVFVLGKEKGLALVESVEGAEAMVITSDKKIYMTKGFKAECDPEYVEGCRYEEG